MTLTLYKTDLRPEANEVFDSMDEFIGDCGTPVHQWTNLKYTKPDIDIMVKVPLDGSIRALGQFDYAVLYDEKQNRNYYYFVLNTNWKAQQTLQLQLSMDTLNSFWTEIKASLGPQTHITRRYFDRWKKAGTIAYPLIDKHPEEISTPPMVQIGGPKLVGSSEYWTLVYMTDYAPDDSDSQQQIKLAGNPVSCYAVPSVAKLLAPGHGAIRVSPGDFEDGTVFVVDYKHNGSVVNLHWEGLYFNTLATFDHALSHDDDYAIFIVNNRAGAHYLNGYGYGTNGRFTQSFTYIDITNANAIYIQPSGVGKDTPYSDLSFNNPINFGGELIPFSAWFESNKTNSRLIKIIELPYAPFDIEYQDGNKMVLPTGWSLSTDGLLKLIDNSVELKSSVASFDNLGPDSFTIADVISEDKLMTDAQPIKYETKLWSSAYHTLKFAYDNQAQPIKLEEFEFISNPNYSLGIEFYPSTGMDNSMGFKFNSTEQLDTDFGNWLISSRTTEVPQYTNEYLNYLRYGKAVDERNSRLSAWSAGLSGVGSAVSTSASLAFTLGGAFKSAATGASTGASAGVAGAIIGGVIGLAAAGLAVHSTVAKSRDTINSKIDQYTHQSSKIVASNDLSIFRKYGKNKLLQVEYEPTEELQNSIGRYFHLFGYSCDEYGVPNWKTRLWSDYFVLEPQWWQTYIIQQYLADITARLQTGFRVLHRLNISGEPIHYDFDARYENWERSLL